MNWLLKYLLLAIIVAPLLCHAQSIDAQALSFSYPSNHNTYYIDTLSPISTATASAMYWIDSTKSVTVSDLNQLGGRDIFHQWENLNQRWNKPYNYWVRISLFNALTEEHTWMLNLGQADMAEMWLLHEQGGVEERQAGLLCRFNDPRWIQKNGQAAFPVTIPSRKTITVYACLTGQQALAPQITAQLQTLDAWDEQKSFENVLQQVILAFLLLLLAVNLPAILWQKHFSHVFFLTFALIFSAWMLYEYGYFRASLFWELPIDNWRLGMISMTVAQPLFLWFLLLQLKPRNPILQLWVWIRSFFAVVMIVLFLFNYPIPIEWANRTFWVLDVILIGIIGFVGKNAMVRNGDIMERWIFGSGLWLYSFLMLGMISYAAYPSNGIGVGHPIGLYLFQIGGIGSFLMYLWATIKYSISHSKINVVLEPWIDDI